jgi:predicted Zn-dependent protease
LVGSGQLAKASETVKRVFDIDPEGTGIDSIWLIDLFADRPQETLAHLPKRHTTAALFATALAEQQLGHAAESQRALDALISGNARNWAYQIADVYAWRGENDHAFEWLDRAYQQHDAGLTRLKFDRLLEGVRVDPRYRALLRKMNLPE